MTPETDESLLALAAGGDREAFGRLVERHRERLYAVASRVVRDRDLAFDALQEALVRAWRNAGLFRGEAKASTWLVRIVLNTSINHLRSRRRKDRERAALPDGDVLPDRASPGPVALALRGEMGEAIGRAIEALPHAQRTALVLCDVEGLSYQEIADAMGCARGTVMSRIFYARQKLREKLAGWMGARDATSGPGSGSGSAETRIPRGRP